MWISNVCRANWKTRVIILDNTVPVNAGPRWGNDVLVYHGCLWKWTRSYEGRFWPTLETKASCEQFGSRNISYKQFSLETKSLLWAVWVYKQKLLLSSLSLETKYSCEQFESRNEGSCEQFGSTNNLLVSSLDFGRFCFCWGATQNICKCEVLHLLELLCEHAVTTVFCCQKSGIADLLPGTVIDDFLFDPCGYSMNGILPTVSVSDGLLPL